MAKRPQATRVEKNTAPTEAALRVVADPVQTAVLPGYAGAPIEPPKQVEPAPPDLQAARDAEKMAKAWGQASAAAANYDLQTARVNKIENDKEIGYSICGGR